MTDLSILSQLAASQVWQSVVIAAVLAVALGLCRKASGSARYAMASAAFVASALLPLVAFFPGEGALSALLKATGAPVMLVDAPAPEAAAAVATPAADPAEAFGREVASASLEMAGMGVLAGLVDASAPAVAAEPVAAPAAGGSSSILPVDFRLPDLTLPFLVIWAAGAAVLLLRTGRDLAATEKLVAEARPASLPMDLARRMRGVRVLVSPQAPGPMAAGLVRPSVILPEGADRALSGPGAGALLEHERAHIERRDTIVAVAQRLVLALMWWSPALYWISRRMDEEREVACDEAAVARTGDAHAFAGALTRQAESQLWARAPKLAVGAIGPRSQFGNRVRRLLTLGRPGGPSTGVAARAGFAALVFAAIAAACLTPVLSASADGRDEQQDAREEDNNGRFWLAFNDVPEAPEAPEAPEGPDAPAPPEAPEPPLPPEGAHSFHFEGLEGLNDPELEAEFAALGAEMAALGAEISATVGAEVMAELPGIMEEVRLALEEAGMDSAEAREEMRLAMEEARIEIERELGPEFREELRRSLEEARHEIEASRGEMRRALEEAREEMQRARENGWDEGALEGGALEGGRIVPAKFASERDASRALYRAAAEGEDERVLALIRAGGNPNVVLQGDGTPLIAAARNGEADVVRLLLKHGADANLAARGDGTPLIAAAQNGEAGIVKILLDAGADVNGAVRGDGNPLIAAARAGEAGIVRMLLDRGADVDAYVPGDETALFAAVTESEMGIVKLLVERGADLKRQYRINAVCGGETKTQIRTVLDMARCSGDDSVVSYLKSKGA